MSKIKNGGLDKYGAEPFEPQQFGTAGGERVNNTISHMVGQRSIETLIHSFNQRQKLPILQILS